MQDVLFTPLKRIATPGGDVLHGMKAIDAGFAGFGEAYFSIIDAGVVKGWKRHNRMTLNFVVPCGEVQVRIYDETSRAFRDFRLGPADERTYGRLTIPPTYWVAFGGLGVSTNMMLNVASIPHDPLESDRRDLDAFPWTWLDSQCA